MHTSSSTRPRIVVLDGYTLNPGDLDWGGLRAMGELTVYDRSAPDEVLARAAKTPIVLTNKTPLDATTIRALPQLQFIGVLATGYNIVDVAAAAQRGVLVANVPSYGAPAVAQTVFALLLELTHHVGHHAATVQAGRWCDSPDFCYWDFPLVELAGRTLGIVGYGAIGRAVAAIGRAFGMPVIAHTVPPCEAQDGIEFLPLDDVFRRADVLTLHCPLTPDTAGLVRASRLALMKPTALLINTGRGPLVVEQDLADALNQERLAGAGLDVLAVEPPRADNPLLTAKNCLITPHIAWATQAARQRLLDMTIANVAAFLAGTPQNVVRAR